MATASMYEDHPSYFWSCLTMQEECPFFSTTDPTLYYFGGGILVLYVAFVLMLLADLKFYWSLDSIQQKLDYYVNLVRTKVRLVQKDQRRLMTTQERTEKQLKRSLQCTRVLTALRGALSQNDSRIFSDLSAVAERAVSPQASPERGTTWPDSKSDIDF